MDKKGSWSLFFISIGLLFIVFSPSTTKPIVLIIFGLMIIVGSLGVKLSKKRKERRK